MRSSIGHLILVTPDLSSGASDSPGSAPCVGTFATSDLNCSKAPRIFPGTSISAIFSSSMSRSTFRATFHAISSLSVPRLARTSFAPGRG